MRCLRVMVLTTGAVDGSERRWDVMCGGRRSTILSSRERRPSSMSFMRARPAVGLEILHAWKRVSVLLPTEEMQWDVMLPLSRMAMDAEGQPHCARISAAEVLLGSLDESLIRLSRRLKKS